MTQDLIDHVCEHQTCEGRVHSLAGMVERHVHHFWEIWDEHHFHGSNIWGAYGGIIVVLAVAGIYVAFALGLVGKHRRNDVVSWLLDRGSGRRRRGEGDGLLHRRSRSLSSSFYHLGRLTGRRRSTTEGSSGVGGGGTKKKKSGWLFQGKNTVKTKLQ